MENNNEKNSFTYSYSAKEQEELKRIRAKYTASPKEESKFDRLRRLDNRVTQKAQAFALVFGVLGALTLGFGMSLIMTDLYNIFDFTRSAAIAVGVVIGSLGGVLACLAYPVYCYITNRERAKIADEVIRLTDELIK